MGVTLAFGTRLVIPSLCYDQALGGPGTAMDKCWGWIPRASDTHPHCLQLCMCVCACVRQLGKCHTAPMPVSLAHSGQCCTAACLWSGCDCIEPVVTLSPRLVPPVAGQGLDPGPTLRFHGTERVRACHLVQRCCQDQRGQGRDPGPSDDPGQVPVGLRPGLGVGVRRACPSGQEAARGASPPGWVPPWLSLTTMEDE